MSAIIDINHETGDLSQYTSSSTDGGHLSVAASAALAGTGYGMQCYIADTATMYGEGHLGLADTSGKVRLRFYFDPNTVTVPNYGGITLAQVFTSGGVELFRINYAHEGGTLHYISLQYWPDTGYTSALSSSTVTDAPHYIEVYLLRATSAVSLDGLLQLWVDGNSQIAFSNSDNYDTFANFDYIRIGLPVAPAASTSGTVYLDELVVNNDGGVIGPKAAATTVNLAIFSASNHLIGGGI